MTPIAFRFLGFKDQSLSPLVMVQFRVLQGVPRTLIPNCMGFCHGQILIETATYSSLSVFTDSYAWLIVILEHSVIKITVYSYIQMYQIYNKVILFRFELQQIILRSILHLAVCILVFPMSPTIYLCDRSQLYSSNHSNFLVTPKHASLRFVTRISRS